MSSRSEAHGTLKKLLIALVCVTTLIAIALLGGAWLRLRQEASNHSEAEAALSRLASQGLATTIEGLNSKYPSTAAGRKAVSEAGAVLDLLHWDASGVTRGTVPYTDVTSVPAFRLARLLHDTPTLSSATLYRDGLLNHVASNRVALDRIARLPALASLDELGWNRSFDQLPPIPRQIPQPGGNSAPAWLIMRESARVLLPCALYFALEDKDTERAWTLAESWLYLDAAFKSQGFCFADAMVGVGLDKTCLLAVHELLQAAPPNRSSALRMARALDPERMQIALLYGYETEFIYCTEFLRYRIREQDEMPVSVRGREQLPGVLSRSSVSGIIKPELWQAIGDHAIGLEAAHKCIFSTDRSMTASLAGQLDMLINEKRRSNPVSFQLQFIPSIPKVVTNVRAATTWAGVLRCALLLRAAEIDAAGDRSKMPLSMEAVCRAYGFSPPRDYLATGTMMIRYTPDRAKGRYTLSTERNGAPFWGENGYVFEGTW